MELLYAHLADYATIGAGGKPTLVHVFDFVVTKPVEGRFFFPPCYLVASLSTSVGNGSRHRIAIDLVDDDEQSLERVIEADADFRPTGPGRPLRAQLIAGFGAHTLSVPALGDYGLRFLVDGAVCGRLPVTFMLTRPATGESG